MELLMTSAICVFLTATGMIAMYQVMGNGNGLYVQNQMQQVEISRILLQIENDFYNASRVYLWSQRITESSGDLSSNTHAATSTTGDAEVWNLAITPDDESTFLTNWKANNGNIGNTASDANNYYYTLLFLGSGKTINAVLYLTCTQSGSGVTYTMKRYENNTGRLVLSNNFSFAAAGASFTSSDQSAGSTTFPSITKNGSVYCGFTLRFPTAFSKAVKDLGTGNQARRVKYTADTWGTWTFVPGEQGRWVKQ